MKKVLKNSIAAVLTILLGSMLGGNAFAASNSSLTQVINPGTLTTDIADATHTSVTNPTVTMSASNIGFGCSTTTGTIGTNTARLYVSNAGAAGLGWSLTAAATSGYDSNWTDQSTGSHYDFNDATGSGCNDGVDTDDVGGQLRIDPSVGTFATDCQSCTTTGISKGTAASFNQGTTDTITLLNAGATSDDIWRGYLTGVGLTQTIPGSTDWGSYSLGLTLTATAL